MSTEECSHRIQMKQKDQSVRLINLQTYVSYFYPLRDIAHSEPASRGSLTNSTITAYLPAERRLSYILGARAFRSKTHHDSTIELSFPRARSLAICVCGEAFAECVCVEPVGHASQYPINLRMSTKHFLIIKSEMRMPARTLAIKSINI